MFVLKQQAVTHPDVKCDKLTLGMWDACSSVNKTVMDTHTVSLEYILHECEEVHNMAAWGRSFLFRIWEKK